MKVKFTTQINMNTVNGHMKNLEDTTFIYYLND